MLMNKKMIPKPTESELEILQVLWENGPSSVRFVNDKLNEGREVGYTTTLKLMQIMADKGLASRNTDNRTHIYQAAVSEADTQKRLLQKFVSTAFRGSAMKLVMQALGNHQASPEELDEIKALIEKMESDGDENL
ncbi:MAG: BlaI/MecI/CopY family transcriptional regulator [Phaeodactylibacter sp.]|nr:BlaI/MecI/CopY family transcriptional regulator [Phaeodactylibacter sp.]